MLGCLIPGDSIGLETAQFINERYARQCEAAALKARPLAKCALGSCSQKPSERAFAQLDPTKSRRMPIRHR
ncbi:hypothetical protein [Sphingopyxis granuli]|uniref:hypothetical protein n=1 Tax=Sphingopyxis granuli TaxID=267128 RepID=UPI0012E97126|nr:hypothetical protein [Sphingopyxis granuli]